MTETAPSAQPQFHPGESHLRLHIQAKSVPCLQGAIMMGLKFHQPEKRRINIKFVNEYLYFYHTIYTILANIHSINHSTHLHPSSSLTTTSAANSPPTRPLSPTSKTNPSPQSASSVYQIPSPLPPLGPQSYHYPKSY